MVREHAGHTVHIRYGLTGLKINSKLKIKLLLKPDKKCEKGQVYVKKKRKKALSNV